MVALHRSLYKVSYHGGGGPQGGAGFLLRALKPPPPLAKPLQTDTQGETSHLENIQTSINCSLNSVQWQNSKEEEEEEEKKKRLEKFDDQITQTVSQTYTYTVPKIKVNSTCS